jgi:hypothetical protein
MPVPETIQQLRAARASHKAWVVRAEALVNGLPLNKEQVPVVATECEFGKWYYRQGARLQGFSTFDQIETAHNSLHGVYTEIYKLLFEDSTSAMGKLFGQTKKNKSANQKKAAILLSGLYRHYDEIISLLDTLEKDILKRKKEEESNVENVQVKTFRDVSSMMEDLEKDVDSWLK